MKKLFVVRPSLIKIGLIFKTTNGRRARNPVTPRTSKIIIGSN